MAPLPLLTLVVSAQVVTLQVEFSSSLAAQIIVVPVLTQMLC